ncbi:extensin family protein [Shimia sp.]|uniref:extensin-like domain-containing protein n=1 Tax=Shimia sp. TaxID=1954381 RepID=UPI00329A0105
MRAVISTCLIGGCLMMTVVEAGAPKTSIRPVTREHVYPPALPSFAPDTSPRPMVRPDRVVGKVDKKAASAASATAAASTAAVVAAPAAKSEKTGLGGLFSRKGKKPPEGLSRLCKERDLFGKEMSSVKAKLPGCGISSGAIRVYQVSGVRLSTPAIMTCDTARALQLWIDKGMEPATKSYGGGVVELKVAAHYSCRTRNNRKGAKISEHGKGKAIDLSEFRLKNGEAISVKRDWNNGKKGRILKKMHKSACGPFGTVLGPNADRYHKDHFHFDVARHRGGPYCR